MWKWLQGRAKLPTIGKDIDDAMDAIEKDNPTLKDVLPKSIKILGQKFIIFSYPGITRHGIT
jgi:hypothetical protein